MAPNLVIALVLFIGIMMTISWIKRVPPAVRAQWVRKAWLALGIAVLALLALRGNWLVAALGAAIPFVQRVLTVRQLYGAAKSFLGSGAAGAFGQGKRSEVETEFVRMSLDHDTGDMSGEILKGRGKGSSLGALTLEQLLDVLDDYEKADPQSASLLETYLDRAHGTDWREARQGNERSGREGTGGSGQMTSQEAYAVLGLEPGASRAQVLEAHRRLMQRFIPIGWFDLSCRQNQSGEGHACGKGGLKGRFKIIAPRRTIKRATPFAQGVRAKLEDALKPASLARFLKTCSKTSSYRAYNFASLPAAAA